LRLRRGQSKISHPRRSSSLTVLSRSFFLKSKTKLMDQSQLPEDANDLARLRAVVDEYEKKMTDAAKLVARVRHEINNPLAALLGQAQLLLRQEELSQKSRHRAETIEKQAKRIEEIVGQLREIQTPAAALNKTEE
jgi:signal transduction histidine kinase